MHFSIDLDFHLLRCQRGSELRDRIEPLNSDGAGLEAIWLLTKMKHFWSLANQDRCSAMSLACSMTRLGCPVSPT